MEKHNYNKSLYIRQGIILTLVSVFLRLSNIFYRSFLNSCIGSEGLGLYQLIFSVFTFSVTLSTSGISLAVTRLVTRVINEKNEGCVRKTVRDCLKFTVSLSLIIAFFLYVFSDFLAESFLCDSNASPCLKILSLGLPFMAFCTTLKGYFLAIDKGTVSGIADIFEQLLTIFLCIVFFNIFSLSSITEGCIAAMAASSLGETVSFVYNYIAYKRSLRKFDVKLKKPQDKAYVMKGLLHIALPCTLSSAARSLLSTLENVLIPIKLQYGGVNRNTALASYGVLQGMAAPILYFPASFLFSFAFLLIPKISYDRETERKRHLNYLTTKALFTSLLFGVFFFALFYLLSEELCAFFYKNTEAARYLRLLSPLCPLIYLDSVTDNLLKGMDKQFDSMKYNMIDSFLRVLFIILFMGKYKMEAYISIIWFSTIFNAALSLGKLIKLTEIKIINFTPILFYLPTAFLSVYIAKHTVNHFELLFSNAINLILISLLAAAIFIFILTLSKTKKESGFTFC